MLLICSLRYMQLTKLTELDCLTHRLTFRQKGSKTGKTADAYAEMFKVHDTEELHDVHIWCTTVLHALPVYLREEVSGCLRTFVAVLAGIVLVNLKGMFKQYYDVVTLWRRSKIDLVIWLVTWVSTVLLNLDLGLAASIVFALFTVTFRTQMPTYSVLGNVPGTELYVDVETHKEAREVPGVTIFRSSATVYFANAEFYLEALKAKSGLDISKMIIYKRRQEAKQRRREKSAERRAKKQAKKAAKQHSGLPEIYLEEVEADDWRDPHIDMTAAEKEEQSTTERGNGTVFVVPTTPRTPDGSSRWEYLKSGDPDSTSLGWISELPDGDTTTLGSSSEDTLSRDLEQVSLGSLGKWTWDIHSIILDLSTVNFIDTVAIQALKNVFRDFIEIDVDIYFCGCQSSVIEQLERGDFFSETIRKQHMFVSVHDAVLYCLNHRGAASLPRYDPTQVLQSGTKF